MRLHLLGMRFLVWPWALTSAALTALVLTGTPAPAQSALPVTLDLTRLAVQDPATRRIAVTVTRGVRSGRDLRDYRLKAVRKRMVSDQSVTIQDLRALADAGDGLAALRLAKRIKEGAYPTAADDMAHYYGIAASTGRVAGLFGLVRMLEQVDPAATSPVRLRILKDIVLAYALAGNSVALEAMLDFHVAERPFGPMPDEMARLAAGGHGRGRAVIALQLASDLIQTRWDDPAALARAKVYLDTAVLSDSVRVKLIAGNLLPVLDARLQTLALVADMPETNG